MPPLPVFAALACAARGPAISSASSSDLCLFLEGPGPQGTRHLPIRIAEEPSVGPVLEHEGQDLPAHADGGRLLVALGSGKGAYLELGDGSGAERSRLPVPVEPAAVHLLGDRALVGHDRGVLSVDLSTGEVETLHERELRHGKAYDLLLRGGRQVLAVDDIAMPFYAELFELHEEGDLRHVQGWRLPAVINGHYEDGCLHEGTAYLRVPFGVMSGHGQLLYTVSAGAQQAGAGDMPVNARASSLEEFVPRGPTGQERRLFAGDRYTPWTGMAVAHDRLWLAAGERGLFALPLDAKDTTDLEQVALDGPCLDVTATAGSAWVLVGGDEVKLAELTGTGGSFAVEVVLALEGDWTRFVD